MKFLKNGKTSLLLLAMQLLLPASALLALYKIIALQIFINHRVCVTLIETSWCVMLLDTREMVQKKAVEQETYLCNAAYQKEE